MLLQGAKALLGSTRSVASNVAALLFIRLVFLLFRWTKKHLAANMMSGGGSAKEVSSADEPQASDATNRVVIDIRDANSGEIEYTFRLPRSHKLQSVFDTFRGRRGREDTFILKLDGRRVEVSDTPTSLGMPDHVELSCVPAVKVVIRNCLTLVLPKR